MAARRLRFTWMCMAIRSSGVWEWGVAAVPFIPSSSPGTTQICGQEDPAGRMARDWNGETGRGMCLEYMQ